MSLITPYTFLGIVLHHSTYISRSCLLFIPHTCLGVALLTLWLQMKSSRGIPGESRDTSVWRKNQIRARKKVANIVIALIILFFICWLPRTVFLMMTFYGRKHKMMTPEITAFRISKCKASAVCR